MDYRLVISLSCLLCIIYADLQKIRADYDFFKEALPNMVHEKRLFELNDHLLGVLTEFEFSKNNLDFHSNTDSIPAAETTEYPSDYVDIHSDIVLIGFPLATVQSLKRNWFDATSFSDPIIGRVINSNYQFKVPGHIRMRYHYHIPLISELVADFLKDYFVQLIRKKDKTSSNYYLNTYEVEDILTDLSNVIRRSHTIAENELYHIDLPSQSRGINTIYLFNLNLMASITENTEENRQYGYLNNFSVEDLSELAADPEVLHYCNHILTETIEKYSEHYVYDSTETIPENIHQPLEKAENESRKGDSKGDMFGKESESRVHWRDVIEETKQWAENNRIKVFEKEYTLPVFSLKERVLRILATHETHSVFYQYKYVLANAIAQTHVSDAYTSTDPTIAVNRNALHKQIDGICANYIGYDNMIWIDSQAVTADLPATVPPVSPSIPSVADWVRMSTADMINPIGVDLATKRLLLHRFHDTLNALLQTSTSCPHWAELNIPSVEGDGVYDYFRLVGQLLQKSVDESKLSLPCFYLAYQVIYIGVVLRTSHSFGDIAEQLSQDPISIKTFNLEIYLDRLEEIHNDMLDFVLKTTNSFLHAPTNLHNGKLSDQAISYLSHVTSLMNRFFRYVLNAPLVLPLQNQMVREEFHVRTMEAVEYDCFKDCDRVGMRAPPEGSYIDELHHLNHRKLMKDLEVLHDGTLSYEVHTFSEYLDAFDLDRTIESTRVNNDRINTGTPSSSSSSGEKKQDGDRDEGDEISGLHHGHVVKSSEDKLNDRTKDLLYKIMQSTPANIPDYIDITVYIVNLKSSYDAIAEDVNSLIGFDMFTFTSEVAQLKYPHQYMSFSTYHIQLEQEQSIGLALALCKRTYSSIPYKSPEEGDDYNTMKAKNSPHLNPIVYEYYDSLCMYNHLSLYDNLTSISDQEIRDKEWLQESMHKDKDDRSGSGGFEEDKKLHIPVFVIATDEETPVYLDNLNQAVNIYKTLLIVQNKQIYLPHHLSTSDRSDHESDDQIYLSGRNPIAPALLGMANILGYLSDSTVGHHGEEFVMDYTTSEDEREVHRNEDQYFRYNTDHRHQHHYNVQYSHQKQYAIDNSGHDNPFFSTSPIYPIKTILNSASRFTKFDTDFVKRAQLLKLLSFTRYQFRVAKQSIKFRLGEFGEQLNLNFEKTVLKALRALSLTEWSTSIAYSKQAYRYLIQFVKHGREINLEFARKVTELALERGDLHALSSDNVNIVTGGRSRREKSDRRKDQKSSYLHMFSPVHIFYALLTLVLYAGIFCVCSLVGYFFCSSLVRIIYKDRF